MKGNQDVSAPNDSGDVSVSITDDVRTSRKRGLTEGSSGTQSARKVLAVLGEGSAAKPRRKVQMEVAGGIATWKELITKKWDVKKYGKEWVLLL
ncbi:hypothetical protein P3S67_017571 [Capsicum chacoense]